MVDVLRVEPECARLVLAEVGNGIHGIRLGAFHTQNLDALARLAPPAFTQGQRDAARGTRRHGHFVSDAATHVNRDVLERRVRVRRRLGPVLAAAIHAPQGSRRSAALAQIGNGEGFLDYLQPICRALRPHDGRAGRVHVLLLPYAVADHLNAYASAELASTLVVMVEQFPTPIHERLLWIIRQADGGLPLGRGVAKVYSARA